MKTLVLGGIRSGKSVYAERLIESLPAPYTYIATAQIWDPEMQARVDEHIKRRGPNWQTLEAPLELPAVLSVCQGPVLVDCLSLWLTNYLVAERDPKAATEQLISQVAAFKHPIVLVSNEVGLGGISANKLQRRFADACGSLNQAIAQVCDQVTFIAAGLPLTLKG